MFKFKRKQAYYSVHALRDKTIWLATLTQKPRKTKYQTPEIDEDGIHRWFLDEEDPARLNSSGRSVMLGTIANCLNLKRVLREQIEPKIDALSLRLTAIEQQLSRIESAIGKLAPVADPPRGSN